MIHCRALLLFVLATLLGAAVADRASADVDVEVPLGFVAKGTLLPAGEIETYRFRAAGRWQLTFQAKAAKGAHLRFDMHLFDSQDAEVPIPAKARKRTPGTLTIRQLRIPSTDSYRLEVSATGTGDYTLTLGGKFPPNVKITQEVPQGVNVPFNFTAPAKSRVALTARAAPGSPAKPRFAHLVGEGLDLDLSALGTTTANSHTVVIPSVGGKGDLAVEVVNPDGATGDVVVTATVTPLPVTTVRLDNRGGKRGHAGGGETVVARSIGAAGGTVEITEAGSELLGAKVTIPPGAVAANTTITVASAPAVTPPDAGDQAAGPALFLGPSGLTFSAPVEVVLPFDPAQIPVGQTAQDLRVLVVEANGSSSILAPTSVDELGRAITVEANGFSTCIPIVPTGQQPLGIRPGGDQFWVLSLEGNLAPDGNQDSRAREYSMEVGEAAFRTAGVVDYSLSEWRFTYDNATAPDGDHLDGNLVPSTSADDASGTWTYGGDGQTVLLTNAEGTITFMASADGNYLVARGNAPAEPSAEALLLVRKNTATLTKASLAGAYHLMVWSVEAENRGEDAGVVPQTSRLYGTWTFRANGTFTVTGTERKSRLSSAGNPSSRLNTINASGKFSVDSEGRVVATIPPQGSDQGLVVRLLPGPVGTVLIGTDRDPQGADLQAFVLVRKGAGLGNGTATGAYRGVAFVSEMDAYSVQGTTGPPFVEFRLADFEAADREYAFTFSGSGSVSVIESIHSARRDTLSVDGVLIENKTRPVFVAQSKIDKTGKLLFTGSEGTGPVGAVTRDGMFGCCVEDVVRGDQANGFLFIVKPPPAK